MNGNDFSFTAPWPINPDAITRAYTASGGKCMQGPVWLMVTAYYPVPKSASKHLREDMLNVYVRPTVRPSVDSILDDVLIALEGEAYDSINQVVSCMVMKEYSAVPHVMIEVWSERM